MTEMQMLSFVPKAAASMRFSSRQMIHISTKRVRPSILGQFTPSLRNFPWFSCLDVTKVVVQTTALMLHAQLLSTAYYSFIGTAYG